MSYTVAVTGHRPDRVGGYAPNALGRKLQELVQAQLGEELRRIGETHPGLHAISGMAQGVDQWFAQECVRLGIPFTAAVPCDGQEVRWPTSARERYAELLGYAAKTVVVCPGPYQAWKMQRRNQWMVDRCNLLLAVWDGGAGGTANCVLYAAAQGRWTRRLDVAKLQGELFGMGARPEQPDPPLAVETMIGWTPNLLEPRWQG